jgi:hypothetical protein
VNGNVPAKDDLSNVYLYLASNEADELILYAGLERLDPSGDSHIDIEINQSLVDLDSQPPCESTCRFIGQKTDGDILAVMDFENGGALGFVEVYRWSESNAEWQFIQAVNNGSGEGCNAGTAEHPADSVCAFNNGDIIPNGSKEGNEWVEGGWDSYNRQGNVIHDLEPNAFTEMGINITQLFGEAPCFTSVMAKSRSSSSLSFQPV